jgi:biopolymer transport protein ExbD
MEAERSNGLAREPNVLPLIDILLVLIIAAMLPFMFPHWRIDTQLPVPASESSSGPAESKDLVLSIARGPSYSLNGQPIARDSLVSALAKVFDGRPEKVLFIDGARDVRYQDVYWVYGAVRSAGVTVTALVPPETRRR